MKAETGLAPGKIEHLLDHAAEPVHLPQHHAAELLQVSGGGERLAISSVASLMVEKGPRKSCNIELAISPTSVIFSLRTTSLT